MKLVNITAESGALSRPCQPPPRLMRRLWMCAFRATASRQTLLAFVKATQHSSAWNHLQVFA